MGILKILTLFLVFLAVCKASTVCQPEEDVWRHVPCDEPYMPRNCRRLKRSQLVTVKDYERCAPAYLPLHARNFYLAAAGEGFTKQANRDAFNRIDVIPKMMRDITNNSLEISTLNQTASMPIGIAPTAWHGLAHPDGELATARAAVSAKTIMILSVSASKLLEDVAKVVEGTEANLWMHVYVSSNRTDTINLVRRAERSGFKALAVTVDTNVYPQITCQATSHPDIIKLPIPNIGQETSNRPSSRMTFDDLRWLAGITSLPVVAKGILSGEDARKSIEYGASAILVSNHGGRQMDFAPATIDALPGVVEAVKDLNPRPDVYLDGGVRTGFDVYKALARGAKMVFIGRPAIWGLILGGTEGVKHVLDIFKRGTNETMLLAGARNPGEIQRDTLSPMFPTDK